MIAMSNAIKYFPTAQDDLVAAVLEHDWRPTSRKGVRRCKIADTEETPSTGSTEEPSPFGDPITKSAGIEKRISITGTTRQKSA